nr:hypothetical protein [uncultured Carboxylicivirga sp.]
MILPTMKRYMKKMYRSLTTLIILLCIHTAYSQQLDQIGKKDAVKVNGGINVNQVYRSNAGSGVDPYAMVITGNVNTSLYGFSVPLSFSWSNRQWTYTQPFNQFSLSPSYKWVTAHMGWSSMSFSPYSLSGHSFSGGGVDLTPGDKFKFSAMCGQLLKAAPGDTIQNFDPQYRRMGTGFKASYNTSIGEVGVHLFYGSDNTDKPVEYIDSLGILPQENMVLGTTFSLRPLNRLAVQGEVSVSSLSSDKRISKATDFNGAATHRYHAAKTNVSYSTNVGSIGAGVEYVEPGYNTLGSYYMVNDFVNYTLNLATSLAKGKVTATANVGLRETNLNNQSETDQTDVVQNYNLSFVPSQKISFNASYSNFYNYSFVRTLFDETNTHTEYELLDTLRFTQISENISLNMNWNLKATETVKHSINSGINFQQATQEQSDAVENANSSFINATGGYAWSLVPSDFSLGLNMNYSRNKASSNLSEAYGPILMIRKSMLEKTLRNSLSLSWNGTYTDGNKTGDVLTARLSSGYTLKKQHRFNLSVAWSQRQRPSVATTSYTTATLSYSYNFGWPSNKNDESQKNQTN